MSQGKWINEVTNDHSDSPKRYHNSSDASTLEDPMMSKRPRMIEIPYNDFVSNPEEVKSP